MVMVMVCVCVHDTRVDSFTLIGNAAVACPSTSLRARLLHHLSSLARCVKGDGWMDTGDARGHNDDRDTLTD